MVFRLRSLSVLLSEYGFAGMMNKGKKKPRCRRGRFYLWLFLLYSLINCSSAMGMEGALGLGA